MNFKKNNIISYHKSTSTKWIALSIAFATTLSLLTPIIYANANETFVNWTTLIGGKSSQKTILYDTVNDSLSSDNQVITVGLIDGSKTTIQDGKGDRDASITAFDQNGKELWHTYSGGTKQDYFHAVTEDSQGHYIAVGASMSQNGDFFDQHKGNYDAIIAKYDKNGKLLKCASFGGSEKEEFQDVSYTYDGGYVAVGYTHSTDYDLAEFAKDNRKREAIIVKYNQQLEVEWLASSGAPIEQATSIQNKFEAVVLDDQGNIIVAGTSNVTNGDMAGLNHGNKDGFLVKYSSDGQKIWTKTFGGSKDDSINDFSYIPSFSQNERDGFIITGTTRSIDGIFEETTSIDVEKGYLLKINSDGEKEWIKTLQNSEKTQSKSVLPIMDGYLITGSFSKNDQDFTGQTSYGKEDIYVAHYSKDGYLRNIHSVGGSDKDEINGITYGLKNNYFLYGSSRSTDQMFQGIQGPVDGFLMSLNKQIVDQYATNKYLVPIQALKLNQDTLSMMAPLLYRDAYVEKTGELYTITAYFVNANIMGTQVKAASLGTVSYELDGKMIPALEDTYHPKTQVKSVKITSTDLTKPIHIHIEDTMGDIRLAFHVDQMVETQTPPYFPDIEVTQPDFVHHYKVNTGGSDVDYANDIITLDNGNLVVVGQTYSKDGDFKPHLNAFSNAFINVYKNDGTLIHTNLLGANHQTTNIYASSVIKSNDDGYIVGGSYIDLNPSIGPSGDFSGMNLDGSVHGETDSFIAKYDHTNQLVWMKNFSGSKHDQMKYLLEDKDGFIAVIESNSNDGDMKKQSHGLFDLAVIKYSYNGEKQWQRVIGGRNIDSSRSIDKLKNGNYVLAGHTSSKSGDFENVDYYGDLFDIFVTELSPDGKIIQTKTYGGDKNDYCNKILGTTDGGFLLAGHTNSTTDSFENSGTSYDNAYILKVDRNWNIEWSNVLKSSDKSETVDIQERNNHYIIFGDTRGNDFDFKDLNKGSRDTFLARYNKQGKREYLETIGGTDTDYASKMKAINKHQNALLLYGPSNDGDLKGLNKGDYDGTLIIYSEEQTNTKPEINPSNPIQPEVHPQKPNSTHIPTGNNTNVLFFYLLLISSFATFISLIYYHKQKKLY